MKDINYALVEEKRPPIYTAMKYWGKKPHNIWHDYIKNYTNSNGVYLDPFSGSAMSALEAVRAGKRAIAFDINPLTSFLIEVFSSKFKKTLFEEELNKIVQDINNNEEYQKLYNYNEDKNDYIIQHAKWNNDTIYEIGYFGKNDNSKKLNKAKAIDYFEFESKSNNIIYNWIQEQTFPKSIDISDSMRKQVNNNISGLWTKRNLFILSMIFEKILNVKDESVKTHLVFGFIQTVHLTSKMCIPRSSKSNRPFSTSWGRSAYMLPKKHMEMNPLLLFQNSCIGKQSVESSIGSLASYLGKLPKTKFLEKPEHLDFSDYDIIYGIQDIKNIAKVLPKESVDFIMTDPPYGGLVKYLDLSYIWLIWLEKYNPKYKPHFEDEIIVKKTKDISRFEIDLTEGFRNIRSCLKNDGKIVFTFHNNDLQVWNAFLRSVVNAGFEIEKVIHQQNKRSGESNVKDPYGTSSSDFYIRCVKSLDTHSVKIETKELEDLIVTSIEKLIKKRHEPTHYQILFNAILVIFSENHYDLEDFDFKVQKILSKYLNTKFVLVKDKWWLYGISFDDLNPNTLSNRVSKYVDKLVSNCNGSNKISEQYIYEKVFKKFPNGMTPDVIFLKKLIAKKIKE